MNNFADKIRKLRMCGLVLFLCTLSLVGCQSLGMSTQGKLAETVIVKDRDLILQSKEGNGEGLAKGVPGKPILVNNQLIFQSMGNVALGIAMGVGAIKKDIDVLQGMQDLDLVTLLNASLSDNDGFIEAVREFHKGNVSTKLLLQPYSYLNGHPKAYLETRIHLTTIDDEGNDVGESSTLSSKKSDRVPIEGDSSWSENRGELLVSVATKQLAELIPLLVESLLEQKGLSSK